MTALDAVLPVEQMCFPVHVIPQDDDDDRRAIEHIEAQANSNSNRRAREELHDDDDIPMPDLTSREIEDDEDDDEVIAEPTPFDFDVEDLNIIADEQLKAQDSTHSLEPSAQLLHWHYCLGHLPFRTLQEMSKQKILPTALSKCKVPQCAACLYGKATKRAWRSRAKPGNIAPAVISGPGCCVSVDQIESSTTGLIAQLRGFLTRQRYIVATVFVDHYSRLSFIYLQKSTKGDETTQAKRAFEAYSHSHGVHIKHYHADNGRFADLEWRNHLEGQNQTISFSGVNAHFQNAVAERCIQHLQDSACTMLVHARHRWPTAINSHLWPYALRMANDVHNNTPSSSGKAPIELFSKIATATDPRHYHPFGCPVYVLSERQAANGKGAKWVERSRVGINIGNSPVHARNFSLVLNVETGNASPQFHVKHDDLFETVKTLKVKIQWQVKTGFRRSKKGATEPDAPEPVFLPPIDDQPAVGGQAAESAEFASGQAPFDDTDPSEGAPPEPMADHPSIAPDSTLDIESPVSEGNTDEVPSQSNRERSPSTEPSSSTYEPSSSTTANPIIAPPEYRTRTRVIRPPARYQETVAFIAQPWDNIWDIKDYEIQEEMSNPIAFAASSDPDTMYMHEALRAPDRSQFLEAMQKEIQDHEDLKHWELVPRANIPQGTTVLPSVWSMKRKRRIDTREVYRWKARLNLHGGKQIKDVHFWETYSPVVKWSSIRLFLTLVVIKGWHSRQVDFVLAYPQADIETEMYMEIPKGFEYQHSRKTHCLKLLKNLYGQ
jgi:hypothetical protein